MAQPASPPATSGTTEAHSASSASITIVGAATSTSDALSVGDLKGWKAVTVLLGDQELLVALADDETERQQGLSGVSDFGDFDGMLFSWDQEVSTGFHMKDTLAALDLFVFDGGGVLIDQVTLEPCFSDFCPVFVADSLFRWVLESPAGAIPLPEPGDLLVPP